MFGYSFHESTQQDRIDAAAETDAPVNLYDGHTSIKLLLQ